MVELPEILHPSGVLVTVGVMVGLTTGVLVGLRRHWLSMTYCKLSYIPVAPVNP
jgi:hypothetical protein